MAKEIRDAYGLDLERQAFRYMLLMFAADIAEEESA
jgi:hypothetical protein